MDRQFMAKASRTAKRLRLLDRIDNLQDMVCAPTQFLRIYLGESAQLLEVLREADPLLADELAARIRRLRARRVNDDPCV